MPRAPDFFQHLTRDDLERLEAFAREPSTTIKKCVEWLQAEGVTKVSKTAVGRWLKQFRETDRQSAAAEIADAIYAASASSGMVDVAGAVNLQVAQRLQSALIRAGDEVPVRDLLRVSQAVNNLGSSQAKFEQLKREGKQMMAMLAAAAKAGTITPEQIEKASRGVFG